MSDEDILEEWATLVGQTGAHLLDKQKNMVIDALSDSIYSLATLKRLALVEPRQVKTALQKIFSGIQFDKNKQKNDIMVDELVLIMTNEVVLQNNQSQNQLQIINTIFKKLGETPSGHIVMQPPIMTPGLWTHVFNGIFVRECYSKIFDLIFNQPTPTSKCVYISGSPGIGKSIFGLYIIHRFLTDTKMQRFKYIAYDIGHEHLWFYSRERKKIEQKNSSFLLNAEYLDASNFIYIADGYRMDPIRIPVCVFIYISSPQMYSKTNLHKRIISTFYMPVWSLDEILACNELMYHVNNKGVERLFSYYGGVPRYLLEELTNEQSAEKLISELQDLVKKHATASLLDFAINQDICSDINFRLMYYVVNVENFSEVTITFASTYIRDQFLRSLEKTSRQNIKRFVSYFADIPSLNLIREIMFELVSHDVLSEGGDFKHEQFSVDTTWKFIKIAKSEAYSYQTLQDLEKLAAIKTQAELLSFYFKPVNKTNGSFDSFMFPRTFYQMTVSSTHSFEFTKDMLDIVKLMRRLFPDDDPNQFNFKWIVPRDIFDKVSKLSVKNCFHYI